MKCVETKRVLKKQIRGIRLSLVVMQKRKKRKFASPVLNVLRWILKTWDVWVWTGLTWRIVGTGGGPL
jgi:hypothetical protein